MTRQFRSSAMKKGSTLRQLFDRDKATALRNAVNLAELIGEIELELFTGDETIDNDGPMMALRLARQLCHALENIECAKSIMANRFSV